jgi:hypothetical protein
MYKRPSYNIKTTGDYIFKTKDKNYNLESFLFERQNDTEDSLQIQDELRGELGSIIIKNSSWNRLSNGDAVRAKSSKGNISGALVRAEKFAKGGGVGNYKVNITKNELKIRKDEPSRVFHSYEGTIGDYTFTAETDSNGSDGINKGSIYQLDVYKTNENSIIARYDRKWDYRTKNPKEGKIRSAIINYIDSISSKKDGEPKRFSKGGNVTERRYVNKEEDYEIRYAKDKPMRKGYNNTRKFAVGGEVGNQVNFRGDYGKKRSGIITGKKNNGYIVSTDDGNVFVESYEIDSFEEAPVAKKKRFGFFEGGGEIEGKISDLKSIVDDESMPEFAREKAKSEIERLKKQLDESKETKAEERKFKIGDFVSDSDGDIFVVDRLLPFNKRFNSFEVVINKKGSSNGVITRESDLHESKETKAEEKAEIRKVKPTSDSSGLEFLKDKLKTDGYNVNIPYNSDRIAVMGIGKGYFKAKKQKAESILSSLKRNGYNAISELDSDGYYDFWVYETKAEEKAEHNFKIGSKIGFLRPNTGRYEYADVISIDGENVNFVVRHPKRSQLDNYFTETKSKISKGLDTSSEDWKDGRALIIIKKETKAEKKPVHSEKIKMYIPEIKRMTGTSNEAVEKFIKDNDLTEDDVYKLMQGLGQRKLNHSEFVTALIGNNKAFTEKFIKAIKSESKMEDIKAETKIELRKITQEEWNTKKKHDYASIKDGQKYILTNENGATVLVPVEIVKSVKPTAKKEIVGYAIVDPISGSIVVSKKTLPELIEASKKLEKRKGFEDMSDLVYEIVKKDDKNVIGNKVTSIDINSMDLEKGGLKKSTAKKEPKSDGGDIKRKLKDGYYYNSLTADLDGTILHGYTLYDSNDKVVYKSPMVFDNRTKVRVAVLKKLAEISKKEDLSVDEEIKIKPNLAYPLGNKAKKALEDLDGKYKAVVVKMLKNEDYEKVTEDLSLDKEARFYEFLSKKLGLISLSKRYENKPFGLFLKSIEEYVNEMFYIEKETPAKQKPSHKKLVAKLKAKKGGKEYDNRASLNTETGERRKRSESSDKKREAKPLGKRISADGSVYYENRLNRGDVSKEDKFEGGGEIGKNTSGWGLKFLKW